MLNEYECLYIIPYGINLLQFFRSYLQINLPLTYAFFPIYTTYKDTQFYEYLFVHYFILAYLIISLLLPSLFGLLFPLIF